MLDSSGSMAGDAGGQTKMKAAKDALERYVTGTPDSFDLGFMVFGHEGGPSEAGKAESCANAELLEPLGEVDYRSFPRTLRRFKPNGWTPIARALEEAEQAFAGREGDVNDLTLVTDGVETCGGDPVKLARRLHEAGLRVTIDVVGFDVAKVAEADRYGRSPR